MVSIEIQLIKEIVPLNETSVIIISTCFIAVVSFVAAFFSDPKAWGLMGLIVKTIKTHQK